MKRLIWSGLIITGLISLSWILTPPEDKTGTNGWSTSTGSNEGIRYSPGTDINRDNVNQLQIVWTYDTKDNASRGTIPTTPIVINGILYGVSPNQNLFAIDAVTGKEKWVFKAIDPNARGSVRGLSYWQDDKNTDKRIFYSTGPKLYAINVSDGTLIQSFGKGGFIDLCENLDGDFANASVAGNAAPIIYKDLLITGMRVSEGPDAAPGHIRAFDVRTGVRRWIFHTIPYPGDIGYDSWEDKDAWKRVGGANNWAGMALDEKRGIVYIPTGSATPDFYGANRIGPNLFANSLIALDAATGKYLWHFQVVHHDLWDRDLPANPNLVRIKKDGKWIDAVTQITKHGYIFMFDRITGKPIFPINEVPVPPSDLPGEKAWPTQPIPTLPEPFSRQDFGAADVSDRTPEIQKLLLEQYYKYRTGSKFIPPSLQGSWLYPGFDGGGEWGGASVDPQTQIMYISNTELPWRLQMIPNPVLNRVVAGTLKEAGKALYMRNCTSCHGENRSGDGKTITSLIDLNKKYNEQEVRQIIDNGRNMMPSYRALLQEADKAALITFLLDLEDKALIPASSGSRNITIRDITPQYAFNGYSRFYDKDGYPGIKPPWGTLNAVNLNTGKLLWKVPLGNFEELSKQGMPDTGTEIYGGPVVTKGGLVFVAGTQDEKIRAFDKKSGKVLWEAKLPAAGFATPAVYTVKGKQYVVIAAGGGKVGMKSGNKYVAFALADKLKR